MPYLGLLDREEREIAGAPGYARRDLADAQFKISPPDNDRDHLVFINFSTITWLATDDWPDLYGLGVYDEVDSPLPVVVRAFSSIKHPRRGDTLVIFPSQLKMSMHIDKGRDWHWDDAPAYRRGGTV